jgi:WD40 repeat protein
VLTAELGGGAFVWDAATGGLVAASPPALPAGSYPVLSPDGSRTATVHGELNPRYGGPKPPHLYTWDVTTGEVREFPLGCDPAAVGWTADGQGVVVAAKGGEVFVYPLRDDQPTRPLGRSDGSVRDLWASPDGRWLVGVVDPEVVVWGTVTGRVAARTPVPEEAGEGWAQVEGFSPDGRLVAVGTGTGAAAIPLPGVRRKAVAFARGEPAVGDDMCGTAAGFAPDGRLLAAAASGPEDDPYLLGPFRVRVWDAASGAVVFESPDLEYAVSVLAFAPDGRRLATASHDTTVLLWDLPTG